jgi:cold shock CspA family protein
MTEPVTIAVCERCGSTFFLSDNYCDWLTRRGVKVIRPMLCMTCFMKVGPLPKQHGVVKWFNTHKRYGFISVEEGEDIFFHQRQVIDNEKKKVCEGQEARFHVHYAEKGPEALNVELKGEWGPGSC